MNVPLGPDAAEADPATKALVEDAAYLLRTIANNDVGKGVAAKVDPDDVRKVNGIVSAFRSTGALSGENSGELTLALSRILIALGNGITIQTLKDTDPYRSRRSTWLFFVMPTFEGRWLSRKLMVATLIFMLVAVAGDVVVRYFGPPLDQVDGIGNLIGIVLQVFTPFTYGAMGACVYLLRSLHVYLYERTYDRRRDSEYVNRVVLGMVSGGAVVLLVEQVSGDGGAVIRFSSAALGFLTGYNTDFLFSTIERVTAAILPKITLESVRRAEHSAESRAITPPTYSELITLLQAAKTDEERKLITATIKELYGR